MSSSFLKNIKYLGKMDSILQELNEANAKVELHNAENSTLKKELDIKNTKLEELHSSNDKISKQLKLSSEEYAEMKASYQMLYNNSLRSFKQLKSNQKREQRLADDRYTALKNELLISKTENEKSILNYNHLSENFAEIKDQMNQLNENNKNERDIIVKELNLLKEEKIKLEKDDSVYREDLKRISDKKEDLMFKLSEKQKEYDQLMNNFNNLNSNYKLINNKIVELEDRNKDIINKMERVLKENKNNKIAINSSTKSENVISDYDLSELEELREEKIHLNSLFNTFKIELNEDLETVHELDEIHKNNEFMELFKGFKYDVNLILDTKKENAEILQGISNEAQNNLNKDEIINKFKDDLSDILNGDSESGDYFSSKKTKPSYNTNSVDLDEKKRTLINNFKKELDYILNDEWKMLNFDEKVENNIENENSAIGKLNILAKHLLGVNLAV